MLTGGPRGTVVWQGMFDFTGTLRKASGCNNGLGDACVRAIQLRHLIWKRLEGSIQKHVIVSCIHMCMCTFVFLYACSICAYLFVSRKTYTYRFTIRQLGVKTMDTDHFLTILRHETAPLAMVTNEGLLRRLDYVGLMTANHLLMSFNSHSQALLATCAGAHHFLGCWDRWAALEVPWRQMSLAPLWRWMSPWWLPAWTARPRYGCSRASEVEAMMLVDSSSRPIGGLFQFHSLKNG